MRRLSGLVILGVLVPLLVPGPTHGQSAYDLFGSARSTALGYASTALPTTMGVNANPAANAARPRRMVSFFARESFGLAPLRYGSVSGTWPWDWGVLSGGVGTFGGDAYRELHYSLGIARSLHLGTSRSVHVGLTGRYHHTHVDGYGNAGAIGLNAGLLLFLLPSLYFGAHATNLNGPALVEGEPLPQTLAVGLQYREGPRVLVLIDVFKDLSFPPSVRGGLEVRPIPLLALRAGITTAPTRFTGGVGLHLGRIRAHLAAEQHRELGWSPSASLEVRW